MCEDIGDKRLEVQSVGIIDINDISMLQTQSANQLNWAAEPFSEVWGKQHQQESRCHTVTLSHCHTVTQLWINDERNFLWQEASYSDNSRLYIIVNHFSSLYIIVNLNQTTDSEIVSTFTLMI